MDIITAKWIVLVTLFLLTFIFSMLPLKLVATFRGTIDPIIRARYAHIISFLSCFAGGVFMATGLLDIFPEVDDILTKVMDNLAVKNSFPVPEFTVAFGFFMVLILEQVVLDYKERSGSNCNPQDILSSQELDEERPALRRHGSLEGISNQPLTEEHPGLRRQGNLEGISDQPLTEDELVEDRVEIHSAVRSMLLVIAISVHSLFEGLAIGLQPNVNSVLQIFIAVILHKVIIAFSLGLNLVQSNLTFWAIVRSNLIFCMTSPIGMGIGMGVEEFSNNVNTSMVNGILQGLACGTFFYVTFFEVLPQELNHGRDRLLKLLAVLIGFSVVCGGLFLEYHLTAPLRPLENISRGYCRCQPSM